MTRVLVCGGRDYRDRATLFAALDQPHSERCIALVIASGASAYAAAKKLGLAYKTAAK